MDVLGPWFEKWRIKVNVTKSEAICFSRRRAPPRQNIRLNGEIVPWKTTVRYLGVTLDKKLTMTHHVASRVRLVGGVASSLKPIIGRHSTLSLSVKTLLYRQLLRPALLYAAPAWYHLTSATARKSLQTLQNKILRQATNSPWFVRNSVIMNSAKVLPVADCVQQDTDRLMGAMETSDWPHIASIAEAERV